MPPPPDGLEEVRKTRMSNLQESTQREKEMAAMLEENVQRRRRESDHEEGGNEDGVERRVKRIPVMLQKVIFWTQVDFVLRRMYRARRTRSRRRLSCQWNCYRCR